MKSNIDEAPFVAFARRILTRARRGVSRVLSPKFLTVPNPLYAIPAMLIISAFVIALETTLFHVLLIVNDYLTATSIIGVAMLGIALGGLISFLLSRVPVLLSTTAAAVLLFASVILAYYSTVVAGSGSFPYLLLLPFLLASFVVSNLFARGGSANLLNFANLVGSGLGVLVPLLLVPRLKSETTLMVLLFVPVAIAALVSLRARNLLVKIPLLALAILIGFGVWGRIKANLQVPETIPAAVFEEKILPELGKDWELDDAKYVNHQWDFIRRVYAKEAGPGVYRFKGDEYDRVRVRVLFGILGYADPLGIPFLGLLMGRPPLADPWAIPAERFEGEIARAFALRFLTNMKLNYDLRFLKAAYRKDGGVYRLDAAPYDRLRAKYLLGELGHISFVDLGLDVRRSGFSRDRGKVYEGNDRILLSEDDLLGRIEYVGGEKMPVMAVNGVALDSMDSSNGAYFDPRVPRVPFLDDPKAFILGLSADGIAKSVRRQPGAVVAGVELNPIVARTMSGPGWFADIANHPYEGVEVHRAEGRAFLSNDPRSWDMIFLMNIHAEHGPLNTIGPENIHTVEGIKLLLSKLTDRGIVVFEEILMNARSDLAFLKFLSTATEALRSLGVADPSKCFHVFRWDFWPSGGLFRTVSIRRTPYGKAEAAQMDAFVGEIGARYPDVSLLYSPYGNIAGPVAKQIAGPALVSGERLPAVLGPSQLTMEITDRLSDPRDVEFIFSKYAAGGRFFYLKESSLTALERTRFLSLLDEADYPVRIDLSPTTDDKPFPYAVYQKKTEITDIISRLLFLSLLLFIPLAALLLRGTGANGRVLFPALAYTSICGFGYMLVEIILLQRFQLFIGDPTWTLVVVLGGLLVFSGLGSLVGHFLPRWLVGVIAILIPVMLFVYQISLTGWFASLGGLAFEGKVWVSTLILLPLAFLMGMPFPTAMEVVKERSSGEFAALLFGVNGGFSTIATAVALFINASRGFGASFTIGVGLYAVGIALFILLLFLNGWGRKVGASP